MEQTKKNITFIVTILLLSIIGFILYLHSQKYTNAISTESPDNKNIGQIYNNIHTYFGVNVDMSQLLPGSMYYVKNNKGEDIIDIAHRLGINLFRIVSGRKSYRGNYIPYTNSQWSMVLDKLQKYHMKAIILVESPDEQKDFYNGTFTSDHTTLLQNLIINSGVGNHPAVLAIDLKNEPILSDVNLQLLQDEASLVHKAFPHILITVGGWRREETREDGKEHFIWNDPKDGEKLKNIVSLYSVHVYNFDKPINNLYPNVKEQLSSTINTIHTYANTIPIIIGEFGAGNGYAITDQETLGSEELQANIYNSVYTFVEQNKYVIGSVSYDFSSRNGLSDGWAIASPDLHNLYLAAYTLQLHTLGHSDRTLALPYRQLPPQKIATIDDNDTTITVNKNSILALSLRINWDRHMSLTGQNADFLQNTEPLYYDSVHYKYDAVFHPKSSGKQTLELVKQQNCNTDNADEICPGIPQVLFSVNIVVN